RGARGRSAPVSPRRSRVPRPRAAAAPSGRSRARVRSSGAPVRQADGSCRPLPRRSAAATRRPTTFSLTLVIANVSVVGQKPGAGPPPPQPPAQLEQAEEGQRDQDERKRGALACEDPQR